MPLMIKLNRNIMKVYLCLDNGHFITVNDKCIIILITYSKEVFLWRNLFNGGVLMVLM